MKRVIPTCQVYRRDGQACTAKAKALARPFLANNTVLVCGNHARGYSYVIPLGKPINRKTIARNRRGI